MTDEPNPVDVAREHLDTIRNGWRHVLDPIRVESGGSAQTGIRPATEDELDLPPDARLDTPITLAFWTHAAIDEWPAILDRPYRVPQPSTDPTAYPEWTIQLQTITVDCGDVPAMCDLLHREADRLVEWVDESGHDFGQTFLDDLEALARAVSRVAWPPKGDRMVIGDCPACGCRLRVKAPAWRRVPYPTTDPEAYPAWQWTPDRDKPITCHGCGREDTFDGWRERLAGPALRLTARQLVADIHRQFGVRYEPVTIRTMARRGLFGTIGYDERGQALYDRVQVFAALMDRERLAMRDRTA